MKLAAACIAGQKPIVFRRAFVFAGSFDPFAMHHREIVEKLLTLKRLILADEPGIPVDVIVWPVGAYGTKQQVAPPADRMEMLQRGLQGFDVTLNLDDLLNDSFGYTSTYQMEVRIAAEFQEALQDDYLVPAHAPVLTQVWHVIGSDIVDQIKEWNEGLRLWSRGRFIVVNRPGYKLKELPPRSIVLSEGKLVPGAASTNIRKLITAKQPWEHLVPGKVAAYIKRHHLYQPNRNRKGAAS